MYEKKYSQTTGILNRKAGLLYHEFTLSDEKKFEI